MSLPNLEKQYYAGLFLVSLDNVRHYQRQVGYSRLRLWEALKALGKHRLIGQKEYKILKARFYEGKSLEEVGKAYQVTRERIRQIEEKTLREIEKIEKPTRTKDNPTKSAPASITTKK